MSDRIGEHGQIKRASISTSATNFYPNVFRLMWFSEGFIVILLGVLLLITGAAMAGASLLPESWGVLSLLLWALGGLFALLAVVLLVLLVRVARAMARNFKNGLLTAGIVEKLSPPSIIHIAVISNGGSSPPHYRYGIIRQNCERLPQSLQKVGRPLAVVSTFDDSEPHKGTWHSFFPVPVAFGTSDKKKQRRCLEAVAESDDGGGNYFDLLRTFVAQNPIPEPFEDLYLCDGSGQLLEVRQITKGNRTTPPPLPS